DRGTIDGAAYWPEGPDDYWRDIQSTLNRELRRYDAVIWMQSAAALGIYDGEASNAVRFEDAAAAIRSGDLLMRLWGGAPKIRTVDAHHDIEQKYRAVQTLLDKLTHSTQ